MKITAAMAKIREMSLLPFESRQTWGRDGSNSYYDFVANVVIETKAQLVLELGTCTGCSTSYLAAAGAVRVFSIDIEQRDTARQALSRFSKVELWQRDTRDLALVAEFEALGPIDLLFIDTHHMPEQAGLELERFGPLVREGGLILLDDARMDGAMTGWWESLDCDKLDLPHLHWSGFGVIFR
jgi:predicted O-methyltransferase YrrM